VAAVLLAGAVLLAVLLASGSSHAMLASARLSCLECIQTPADCRRFSLHRKTRLNSTVELSRIGRYILTGYKATWAAAGRAGWLSVFLGRLRVRRRRNPKRTTTAMPDLRPFHTGCGALYVAVPSGAVRVRHRTVPNKTLQSHLPSRRFCLAIWA